MTQQRGVAGGRGDRSAVWRVSYRSVRKDALRSTRSTNRRRLELLGAPGLVAGRWADVGAGDGNVADALLELGVRDLTAVEPQVELLSSCTHAARRTAGSVVSLPLRSDSVDVAIVMDVLHHVPPDELERALGELRRVLRPGGRLLVCEPADTRVRSVLTSLLMSPLAGVTRFSRHKQRMVREEEATLVPWLRRERALVHIARSAGFVPELRRGGVLHSYHRLRVPDPARARSGLCTSG